MARRIPHSLIKTWFFVILAVSLLVPANLVPIMSVLEWGRAEPDTIVSGIIKLYVEGYTFIALIVFLASVIVPVGKLITLIFLLLSVQRAWPMSRQGRLWAFRVLEFIGRWSMLDIFVVAIMVALVHLGQVAAVLPGMGAMLFGASVIATLLASLSFDSRLIWDSTVPA
jgi:paraquat-inducible protein A